MHGWGLCIQHSLTHVSLGPLDSQLIALLILDSEYPSETLNDSQRLLLSRLSRLFRYRYFRHTPLLTEFFSDPSRSGPFYLDGDKYATLAINFTKYLITELYVCESVKYTFTSRSHLLVNAVHLLQPGSILNTTCFLCPLYCHRHHIQ